MKLYLRPGRSWWFFIVSFKIYSTNLEVGPRSISVITMWRTAVAAGRVCFHSICSQNPICAGLEMMDHMYRQHCKQRRLIKTHFTRHRVASGAKWEKRATAQLAFAEKLLHKKQMKVCDDTLATSCRPGRLGAVALMELMHQIKTQSQEVNVEVEA